jgi:hypothetical protein
MSNVPMEAPDSGEYDIERETQASRAMLEKHIPAKLNAIKLALVEIDKRRSWEPWYLALIVDLVECVERNCTQLLETMEKDRLPASAWLARNLLELWVWVKYCSLSRENAWRFHEDALRDMKGLTEAHQKSCSAMGIADETSTIAAQRIQDIAFEKLGLEDIDSGFLAVANAAKAPGVDLGNRYGPFHRTLSKFAHPTAGLIHGITHQTEACHHMQAAFTTEGVYFAAQATLVLEAHLGLPGLP